MNCNINSIFSENTRNSISEFLRKNKLAMNQNDTTLFTCQLAMIRNYFQSKINECESVINTRVFTKEEYRKAAVFNDRLDQYGDSSLRCLGKVVPNINPTPMVYNEYAKKHLFWRQNSYIFNGLITFAISLAITMSLAAFADKIISSDRANPIIFGVGALAAFVLTFIERRCGLYAIRRRKAADYVYDVETGKHAEKLKECRNMLQRYKPIVNEIEAFLDRADAQEKDAIPRAYWNEANTIYDLIFNKRADSIKEAINLTENIKHQQRLEESQRRAEMASQAAYETALNAQAEARQAHLAAEQAARDAAAASGSDDFAWFAAWM